MVDGQPYIVRGVGYYPTKIGEDPSLGTWRDWMVVDDDHDGRIDAPYQSWVEPDDTHKRGDAPETGDFKLLSEMGCNTIRVYHHATEDPAVQAVNRKIRALAYRYNHAPNKKLLNDLFKTYGIRTAMGDFLGAYAVGSGADWSKGTDYRDAEQKKNMMQSVEAMVRDFKDEPWLLMWVLGNENNYQGNTHTNAVTFPEAYAAFVNEVAERIHALDPHHPVCLCNGETHFLKIYAKSAPAVDIFGLNSYRQPGFGTLWNEVASEWDRPVLLTEYGTLKPIVVNGELNEASQEKDHFNAWCDIQAHAAGAKAPGNAIGGFAFEWLDQWWYTGRPFQHDVDPRGFNNEWQGIASQGDGSGSPLQRHLRKVYGMYRKLWKTGELTCAKPS